MSISRNNGPNAEQEMSTQQRGPIQPSSQEQGGGNANSQAILSTSCNSGPNAEDRYFYELIIRRARESTFGQQSDPFQLSFDPQQGEPQRFNPNDGIEFSANNTQQHQSSNNNYSYDYKWRV